VTKHLLNLEAHKVFRIFIYVIISFILIIYFLLITNELIPSETHPPFDQERVNDFIAYYTGGLLSIINIDNLYSIPVQYDFQEKFIHKYNADFLPFLYPPFVALAFSPLTFLPITAAFNIWTFMNILILSSLIIFILNYYKSYSWWSRIFLILLILAIRPITSIFGFGQITMFLILIILVSWFSYKNKLYFLSGLMLSLLSIKLQYIPLIFLAILLQKNIKMLMGLLLGGISLFIISFINTGLDGLNSYLNFLNDIYNWSDQFGRSIVGQFNIQAITTTIFGINTDTSRIVYLLLSSIITISVIYIWYVNRSTNSYKANMKWSALIIAFTLISPHTNIQDLAFLIPVFIILLPKNVSDFYIIPKNIRFFIISLVPMLFFFSSSDILSRTVLIVYLLIFLFSLIYESLEKPFIINIKRFIYLKQ
jgi:hypothetical protein